MKNIRVEVLTNHAPMAVSIELRSGRRPSSYIVRAVAEFMREHGIEELEVYYGKEAVKGALKGTTPREDDPAPAKIEPRVREQVEPEPLDTGVGVQPSEAKPSPKSKKKRRSKAKKGTSLLTNGGGV